MSDLSSPKLLASSSGPLDGHGYELGRSRRSVNPSPEPPETRFLGEKREVEGRFHDTTEGTRRARTEPRHSFISNVTRPRRPVPSTVLVSAGFPLGGKVAFGFDSIAEIVYVNQGEGIGDD